MRIWSNKVPKSKKFITWIKLNFIKLCNTKNLSEVEAFRYLFSIIYVWYKIKHRKNIDKYIYLKMDSKEYFCFLLYRKSVISFLISVWLKVYITIWGIFNKYFGEEKWDISLIFFFCKNYISFQITSKAFQRFTNF